MRRSIEKADTSTACSASGWVRDGNEDGVVDGEGFPKREANELERREPAGEVPGRAAGRGGSGGLDAACGGKDNVNV